MKLREYARKVGISYQTAWRWWRAGKIKGIHLDTGTILVDKDGMVGAEAQRKGKVVVYGRVSSSENRDNLERQVARLVRDANARGYAVAQRWAAG